LRTAREHLRTAEFNLEGGLLKPAVFFAQQAAETALKALLIHRHGDAPRTHDLVHLAGKLNMPTAVIRQMVPLNVAYTAARYPDVESAECTPRIAKKLVQTAREVVAWIEKNLSKH